jgi:hypothetical protein
MFYSSEELGGPSSSSRSIAKYAWHMHRCQRYVPIQYETIMNSAERASPRRQTVRGRKGADRPGIARWDAALRVVPSKWIPSWICIRSHNWIHTDMNRGDRTGNASWRSGSGERILPRNATRDPLYRTWRPRSRKRRHGLARDCVSYDLLYATIECVFIIARVCSSLIFARDTTHRDSSIDNRLFKRRELRLSSLVCVMIP